MCIIHQIQNSTRYVSYKDLKKVTANLKPIYKAATEESALVELDRFGKTWGGKYPLIIRHGVTIGPNSLRSLSIRPKSANSSIPQRLTGCI